MLIRWLPLTYYQLGLRRKQVGRIRRAFPRVNRQSLYLKRCLTTAAVSKHGGLFPPGSLGLLRACIEDGRSKIALAMNVVVSVNWL